MANKETTRVSAHVDRVLDASTVALVAGAGAGVGAASHAKFAVDHVGVVAEMAAQVVSSEPAATQALDTVDHLTKRAEMAAQVASVEPAATQVLAIAVEMVGVAAVVAAVHD